MPMNKDDYPPYWDQFSRYIREHRASGRCEQCQVTNQAWINRGSPDPSVIVLADNTRLYWFDHSTGEIGDCETGDIILDDPENFPIFDAHMTRVVLTVAHLDHEGGVCRCKEDLGRKCAIPDHVKALCQRCHLKLDMPKHIAKRQETLATRKDAGRGLFELQGSVL